VFRNVSWLGTIVKSLAMIPPFRVVLLFTDLISISHYVSIVKLLGRQVTACPKEISKTCRHYMVSRRMGTLFVSAIGFLQAKNKFCVGYAAAGLQNADEGSNDATKVLDTSAHTKDKQRTRKMYT